MLKNFKFNKIRFLSLVIVCIALLSVTSCSSNKSKKTMFEADTVTGSGCAARQTKTKAKWIEDKVAANVEESYNEYVAYVVAKFGDGSAEHTEALNNKQEILMNGITYSDEEGKNVSTACYMKNVENIILNYVNKRAVANSEEEAVVNSNYLVLLSIEVSNKYASYLTNITTANVESLTGLENAINGSAGCFDIKTESLELSEISKANEITDAYKLAAVYVLEADNTLAEMEPITFRGESAGDFFAHLWNNLFIFPVAWLLYAVSKLCGGYYIVGLIIVTLLVRTLGWPIYAKSNQMSSKMNEMQPELNAIQAKYANRQDPDSQRMMQMEQAQLYKKYKVGIGGCLAPFLQFPIFMAIYRAVSRLPYTKAIAGSIYKFNWANDLNSKIFGLDLFETRSVGGTSQLVGVIVLVLIVVATQVLSQLLMNKRQKAAAERKQEDIPAYRRQAVNQTQNQTQQSMKMMMYMMIFMMGMFVWTSKAGLGVYWCIGNIYSIAQMAINDRTAVKKAEKAAAEAKGYKGLYTIKSKESKTNKK